MRGGTVDEYECTQGLHIAVLRGHAVVDQLFLEGQKMGKGERCDCLTWHQHIPLVKEGIA